MTRSLDDIIDRHGALADHRERQARNAVARFQRSILEATVPAAEEAPAAPEVYSGGRLDVLPSGRKLSLTELDVAVRALPGANCVRVHSDGKLEPFKVRVPGPICHAWRDPNKHTSGMRTFRHVCRIEIGLEDGFELYEEVP